MIPAGFEPATVRLEGECSIQLSYGTLFQLFYSNLKHSECQGAKSLDKV